ncbi:hypothetical protein [Kineosporia babensis]|uniref:Uncharacterized protein n=1 Tax=Kineosporia babensis TaxID=499548 RepID=A0A9X1SWV5_9ACTN|nr:hypothetical protein [Kineosporia babensis]MCD5315144.1 hypothetical protein [Kineosporia babensis]
MHRHQPALTTHTVELDQIRAIDAQLSSRPPITAAMLGMEQAVAGAAAAFAPSMFSLRQSSAAVLGARAVLRHVRAEGTPEYPYVNGRFEDPVTGAVHTVELHSQALHQLCVAMRLSQCWGTDAVLSGSSIR